MTRKFNLSKGLKIVHGFINKQNSLYCIIIISGLFDNSLTEKNRFLYRYFEIEHVFY